MRQPDTGPDLLSHDDMALGLPHKLRAGSQRRTAAIALSAAAVLAVALTAPMLIAHGPRRAAPTATGAGSGAFVVTHHGQYERNGHGESASRRQSAGHGRDGKEVVIAAPLSAGTSPVAVLTDDGTTLVHASWQILGGPPNATPGTGAPEGRPSIWALDEASGAARLLADGANSFALLGQRLAYVKGQRADYYNGEPYVGDIRVQNLDGAGAATVLVPEIANWRIAAWAGTDLLVYKLGEGEAMDLYVVRAGGSMELLAPDSALVAISPDGHQALISTLAATESQIAILDLDKKKAVAHAFVGHGPNGEPIDGLAANGDWQGDTIVAAATGLSGYVTLRQTGSDLHVVAVRDLGRSAYPWRVEEPTITQDGGVMVTAYTPGGKWGGVEAGIVATCFDDGCRSFEPEGPPIEPKRVHNPSRNTQGAS